MTTARKPREREYDRGWREATETWADMRLKLLNGETGEMSVTMAREVMEAMAEPMAAMLDEKNAPNYVECDVIRPATGKRYTMRIQRYEGKTPHQLRQLAEKQLADVVSAVSNCGNRAAIAAMRSALDGV